ncbi:PPOX class F420-dependent oxidoreductase [Nocardia callitridis]
MTSSDDAAVVLDERAKELISGKAFATVATLDEDGAPHTSVVFVGLDGDTLVFSTTAQRRKARNLARDPRIGVTVFDQDNPYRTVDIQGIAELVDDTDRVWSYALTQKYIGEPPPAEPARVRRLVVRVAPRKITGFGD